MSPGDAAAVDPDPFPFLVDPYIPPVLGPDLALRSGCVIVLCSVSVLCPDISSVLWAPLIGASAVSAQAISTPALY